MLRTRPRSKITRSATAAIESVTGLRRVYELLEPAVAERVIFDLGLVRNIGYYTGAVFEVSTTRRSARRWAGAAATTSCSSRSGAACRPSDSRSASTACTWRSPARSAARGLARGEGVGLAASGERRRRAGR